MINVRPYVKRKMHAIPDALYILCDEISMAFWMPTSYHKDDLDS